MAYGLSSNPIFIPHVVARCRVTWLEVIQNYINKGAGIAVGIFDAYARYIYSPYTVYTRE